MTANCSLVKKVCGTSPMMMPLRRWSWTGVIVAISAELGGIGALDAHLAGSHADNRRVLDVLVGGQHAADELELPPRARLDVEHAHHGVGHEHGELLLVVRLVRLRRIGRHADRVDVGAGRVGLELDGHAPLRAVLAQGHARLDEDLLVEQQLDGPGARRRSPCSPR